MSAALDFSNQSSLGCPPLIQVGILWPLGIVDAGTNGQIHRTRLSPWLEHLALKATVCQSGFASNNVQTRGKNKRFYR